MKWAGPLDTIRIGIETSDTASPRLVIIPDVANASTEA